jgi:phenylacetic acid degradation operon negative regulatory protein
MAKSLGRDSVDILQNVKQEEKISIYSFIKKFYSYEPYRKVYTQIYQLEKRGYLVKSKLRDTEYLRLSAKGSAALSSLDRKRDGKWKMIIFDIPEQRREIRDYLRTKLKQLGFKKWQNSIWITPYALPVELVKELRQLSDKYFIRLITVESINNTKGLEELFTGSGTGSV